MKTFERFHEVSYGIEARYTVIFRQVKKNLSILFISGTQNSLGMLLNRNPVASNKNGCEGTHGACLENVMQFETTEES
jgi:hypothetical protein